ACSPLWWVRHLPWPPSAASASPAFGCRSSRQLLAAAADNFEGALQGLLQIRQDGLSVSTGFLLDGSGLFFGFGDDPVTLFLCPARDLAFAHHLVDVLLRLGQYALRLGLSLADNTVLLCIQPFRPLHFFGDGVP